MPDSARREFEIDLAATACLRCARIGRRPIRAATGPTRSLALYWLEGYGGGVWLPFLDATSGAETYGGGRYLYDTIKGADLGVGESSIVLDFNFAYNPSCAYDERWSCPLSPPENRLPFAVNGGRKNALDCHPRGGVAEGSAERGRRPRAAGSFDDRPKNGYCGSL